MEPNSPMTDLPKRTMLIIWDVAPMTHKSCFEDLDVSLCNIIRYSNGNPYDLSFGSKVIVFGGDFRQFPLVMLKGTRQDIVFATLNSSKI